MPSDRPRVAWDADVLLSYIDGEAERLPILDELLRQSRAGEIELVTSALSQVEVAFASSEAESETLDPEIEERIDELWTPSSPVHVVEFHPAIAQAARDLLRQAVATASVV